MYNNVATNYDVVVQKIKGTDASRNEMISSLKSLANTINNTVDWRGPDAEQYKAVLLDFCQKLTNCAYWMQAAGDESIKHSSKLHARAISSQRDAQSLNWR